MAAAHDLTTQKTGEQARTAAEEAANQASKLAATVASKASEAASYVGHKAEDAASALGTGMKTLAGTLREKGPNQGMIGSASSTVANTLETGGRYLQEHGLSGMGADLVNQIRRNPIPAVLVGVGLGFLLARFTSRN